MLVSAPAVRRIADLMTLRGIFMPLGSNCYGQTDRLWMKLRYRSGELRGRSLIRAIEDGVLSYTPREQLTEDIARYGLDPLAPAIKLERAIRFGFAATPRIPVT